MRICLVLLLLLFLIGCTKGDTAPVRLLLPAVQKPHEQKMYNIKFCHSENHFVAICTAQDYLNLIDNLQIVDSYIDECKSTVNTVNKNRK